MADTQTENKLPAQDAQQALEKQVAQLKREIIKINKSIAQRAEAAGDQMNGWYDSASDRASEAAQSLRSQAPIGVGRCQRQSRNPLISDVARWLNWFCAGICRCTK